LDIRLKFEQVDKELSLVSQLLLVVLDDVDCARVGQLIEDVEEHGVSIRLLHDFTHFSVKVLDQRAGIMVNNLVEGLEAHSTLADVSVE